jgi:hypothetical protein
MVNDDDVIDTVTSLIIGCTDALDADGAGLVLNRPDGTGLELLAATSHRTEELELYQVQADAGPCVDAARTGEPVAATSLREIEARWPELGTPFRAARYSAVYATPLHWHGQVLGALNLFWRHDGQDPDRALAQGFADVAALAIVHAGQMSHARIVERTRAALAGRTVVEQAKGVLAVHHDLDMDAAYAMLLAMAHEQGLPLTSAATRVVGEAADRPRRGTT